VRHAITRQKIKNNKMKQLILYLDIVLTGLIAGVILGIWLGYNPKDLSAVAYVEQQQNAILSLNVLMPILGLISILLTIGYAILLKGDKLKRNLLLVATALLVVSGMVTRFGNQPINAIVITWNIENIPQTWSELRDKWWTFHIIRTLTTVISFAVIVWVTVMNKSESTNAQHGLSESSGSMLN
jgi:hypothetical protein